TRCYRDWSSDVCSSDLSSGDAIHQQWNTVAAGIARSRAARAGRQAAFEAAAQAHTRYAVGNVTQLDLLQAQRDAFIADVNRIQRSEERRVGKESRSRWA